ncbi:hypothetical protein MA20_10175 [Bradyrhizobium japonicum]|uniref:Uncharacterized protein n=1 Tax=Bradyrhizobium japonicum TaxID=375 RepID=A0A0A3XZP3_BRAJP|nr:hypothetical protein MA20_10175 [Bradyrhizobium japonicum]
MPDLEEADAVNNPPSVAAPARSRVLTGSCSTHRSRKARAELNQVTRILEPLQVLVTLTTDRCMIQFSWMTHELGG